MILIEILNLYHLTLFGAERGGTKMPVLVDILKKNTDPFGSGSGFYPILVLHVSAKRVVGQMRVVRRKYFDFVEGGSQFSIQMSENSGKRQK